MLLPLAWPWCVSTLSFYKLFSICFSLFCFSSSLLIDTSVPSSSYSSSSSYKMSSSVCLLWLQCGSVCAEQDRLIFFSVSLMIDLFRAFCPLTLIALSSCYCDFSLLILLLLLFSLASLFYNYICPCNESSSTDISVSLKSEVRGVGLGT